MPSGMNAVIRARENEMLLYSPPPGYGSASVPLICAHYGPFNIHVEGPSTGKNKTFSPKCHGVSQ